MTPYQIEKELKRIKKAICCASSDGGEPITLRWNEDEGYIEYLQEDEWQEFEIPENSFDIVAYMGENGLPSNNQLAWFSPNGAQDILNSGAITLTNYMSTINSGAGATNFTIGSGLQIGQVKKIIMGTDGGGDAILDTATNNIYLGADQVNFITFNDTGDYIILQWDGTNWYILERQGIVVTLVEA